MLTGSRQAGNPLERAPSSRAPKDETLGRGPDVGRAAPTTGPNPPPGRAEGAVRPVPGS